MENARREEQSAEVVLPAEAAGLAYGLAARRRDARRRSSRVAPGRLRERSPRLRTVFVGVTMALAVYLLAAQPGGFMLGRFGLLLAGAMLIGLPLAMWLAVLGSHLSTAHARNQLLGAELTASLANLAASRRRLVEAADAERQRIEQSLHDGAQQNLVGLRLRLELAIDAVGEGSTRGVAMLTEIGGQMDEALEEVHNLARGIYPPLLAEHGIGEALRSANRRSPWPASLDVDTVGRYSPDSEAAVYFCCVEALQNIAKHAGPGIGGTVRLWEDGSQLRFEVRDHGVGFAEQLIATGAGLTNIRDRMAAAGGTASVTSQIGRGTVVRGALPICRRAPLGAA